MVQRPLDGLVVVDMGQVLATPFATYLLHLLGAEVIKIEPRTGEWLRNGSARGFATQNAGKHSVAVDLRTDGGAEVVLRLVERADVFVEGFAPGTADSMGLGFDAVAERNSDIVYGSLSAFGASGPYAGRPGFDHVVQAVSGIMWSTGFPDGPPMKVGAPYLDYGGGLLLAFGMLAGILEQRRTGGAVRIDTTMLDVGLLMNASGMVNTQATGIAPPRAGNNAFSGAVASGAFETADGWLTLAANKASHLERLQEVLGISLPDDHDVARSMLDAAFATDTAERWEVILSDAGIPAARVRSLADVADDGYAVDRGLLQPIDVPGQEAPLYVPGAGVRLNGEMPGPTTAAPEIGEHTDDVLARFGFSTSEIADLHQRGVVGPAQD